MCHKILLIWFPPPHHLKILCQQPVVYLQQKEMGASWLNKAMANLLLSKFVFLCVICEEDLIQELVLTG